MAMRPILARVTISDMIACFSYFCNIQDGIGQTDDIDHLGNRRVRCVGELLQTQFRIGLTKMAKTVQQKMSITDLETAKPQALVNIRPLTSRSASSSPRASSRSSWIRLTRSPNLPISVVFPLSALAA
jgi:DNA-directed RNA polymerase beta subunit